MYSFTCLRDFILCNGICVTEGDDVRVMLSSGDCHYAVHLSEPEFIYVYQRDSSFIYKVRDGVSGELLETDERWFTYNDYINYGQLLFSTIKDRYGQLDSDKRKYKDLFDNISTELILYGERVDSTTYRRNIITYSFIGTTKRKITLYDSSVYHSVESGDIGTDPDSVYTDPASVLMNAAKCLINSIKWGGN